ncbi:MAG: lytic transglycosylase domain-containing protein [Deltaproteobacteria bacterium]|nr:lytic transglycosylase domain-containing protein [Deltaproteobacteria bacterium]
MTQVWAIFLLMAALSGAVEPGPPRPIFDPAPSPNPLVSSLPAEVLPPKFPSLYGRRAEVYDRAVAFIREERFPEALALIRKQPKEIREWRGVWVLEAGLISVSDPNRALDIYYAIINQKVRDRHWARAMAGYRLILERLSAAGDYGARAKLVRILGLQWRNQEAMDILEATLNQSELPEEIKAEFQSFGAVLAIRVGDFEKAGEFLQNRKDLPSLRWLSTLRLREGKFSEAAEVRLAVAGVLKGAQRQRELNRAFDVMVKGGLSVMAEELVEKNPGLKTSLKDYNYRLGLVTLIDNRPAEALEYFTAESKRKGANLKAVQYFQARALENLDRGEEALALYREGAAGPMGYYRLLAEGRLAALSKLPTKIALAEPMANLLSDRLDDRDTMGFFLWLSERVPYPWPNLAQITPLTQAGSGDLERSRFAVRHYLSQGAYQAAYQELRAAGESVIPNKTAQGDDLAAAYVLLAAYAGDYRLAVGLINRLKAPSGFKGSRWNHPLVYGRPLLRAYRELGLSPQLVLSVIRTESAFQAEVVSSSNARGLMQLLPSTAQKVAELQGDANFREDDLFDPFLNIRYGTAYLSSLVNAFGSQTLALAAYNGGPFNIQGYVTALPQRPLDLFIETLPFSESSEYVKRVTEAVATYESAYLGKYSLDDFTLPVGPLKGQPPSF